jgi:EmrB/QacA subfamily drug resistance transporter
MPPSYARDPAVYARRWKTLLVLSVALLIIGLDNTVLNVALPTLQEHFATSGSTLQWIVDAYLLAFAGVLLTAGTLGDRFGRRCALLTGLTIFGTGSVLATFAQSAEQLIALRALMGIGGATIMPATLSVLTDVFPREERGKAMAIWSAVAGMGAGLGPFVGGLLLEWFDWTSVFWLNVPIAAVAIAGAIRFVPDSRDPHPGAFDIPGAVLSVAGLTSLVYAIIEAQDRGWTDGVVLGCFAAAVVLGALFAWREWTAAHPMLPLELFKDRSFSVGSLGIGLVFFAMMGASFALTQYLQFAHGLSALESGAAMLPMAVGIALGAGGSAKLTAKLGTPRVVSFGLLLVGAFLLTTLLWTTGTPVWGYCLFVLVLSYAMGLVMAPSTESVMNAVPEAKAGVGSAMNDVTRQVAGSLGVAVVGSIIGSYFSAHMPAGSPDSVGGAHAVGGALAATADRVFTDAMGIGFLAAAAAALAGAVLVRYRLPDRRAAARMESSSGGGLSGAHASATVHGAAPVSGT